MKPNKRKLSLDRETIAPLDLAGVTGGNGWLANLAQQASQVARSLSGSVPHTVFCLPRSAGGGQ